METSRGRAGRAWLAALLVGSAVMGASAQSHIPATSVSNQFATPVGPPSGMKFDNVRGEMVNFETMMAKPIIVTADGTKVIVANEADNRLVVLRPDLTDFSPKIEIPLGQGICAIAERVISGAASEIWVTMRHQAGTVVIDSATWMITHLVRPAIASNIAGTRYADCPGGIAFSADGATAYIASSNTDHVAYFDTTTKAHLGNIPLKAAHNGSDTHMNEPFAMTRVGNYIAVASYRSGNQGLTQATGSVLPGASSVVKDLTVAGSTQSLPDFDVMLIDTATQAVDTTKIIRSCGTVLNNIAAIDATGKLVVSNTEAQNSKFVGEGSFRHGQVVRNRLTIVDPSAPSGTAHVYKSTDNLVAGSNPWVNVVLPTDIAVDSTQRIFVAGYGSSNIGVFSSAGAFIATMPTKAGPLGLAYSSTLQRLYCFNRADNQVTSYDVSGTPPATWLHLRQLVDPTFDIVRDGRKIFLDPSHSGKQTASCASCHLHLRNDGTTWNLSGFYDNQTGFTDSTTNAPQFWADIKGTMQTQSLQSLEEIPGYHWRGEQKDIEDFNKAFVGLLKAPAEMPLPEFAKMKQYIFSAHYPANPFQSLNRDFSSAAVSGAVDFMGETVPDPGVTCNGCHTFPLGSDGGITDALRTVGASSVSTKSAQLRGLWEKTSDRANISNSGPAALRAMTGSSFLHTGAIDGIDGFLDNFFQSEPHNLTVREFLREFDSGVAPAANYCDILDRTHPNGGDFLVDQANLASPNCDLAVRGWWKVGGVFEQFGWYWDRSAGGFVCSDSTVTAVGVYSLAQLKATTLGGNARWIMLGVPLGSGQRIGIDRDRDTIADRDEVTQGLDPSNPDTDGDGYWDGYEGSPLNPALHPFPMTAPVVVAGTLNSTDDYTTTNSIKITYRTNQPSPTRIIYGKSGAALNLFAGDQFPLPLASNLWKRDHTVFIRLTDANQAYDFKVETQGQNGVTALSALFTKSTKADVITNAVTVDDVTLTSGPGPSGTTWTATVTIKNRLGAPVSGAIVNGVFTQFTAGVATAQIVVASTATNASGQTTLTWDLTTTQGVTDGMAFTVPMVTPKLPGGAAGSVQGVQPPSGDFIWPESKKTSEKVIL